MKKYKLQFNKNKTADSNGIIISEDIQFLNLRKRKRNYFKSIQCLILIISAFCSNFTAISFFPNLDIDKNVIGFIIITLSLAFGLLTCQQKTLRYLSIAYITLAVGYILYLMQSVANGFYVVLKAYMLNAKIPNNISLGAIDPKTYSQCATDFFAAFSIIVIFLLFIALITK